MAKILDSELSRIIEMAWEDRTPFEALKSQFGISEKKNNSIDETSFEEKFIRTLEKKSQ